MEKRMREPPKNKDFQGVQKKTFSKQWQQSEQISS